MNEHESPRVRIPGVVLEEELGQGASSVVYRGVRNGRPCAVKIPRTQLRRVRWFRKEAAALARVRHPGLPLVLEVGEAEGIPYLVMELVEGRTLAERLASGPLHPAQALSLGLGLAEILATVHRRGLVHRDVKPRNIVLRADGEVRLIDFGLATFDHRPRNAAGTRAYAAPEQVRVPVLVDPRTDLYGLGVVLHECLTGAPYRARAPLRDSTGPLADWYVILRGLLQEAPGERYGTAEELSEDLRRLGRRATPRGPDPRVTSVIEADRTDLIGRADELAIFQEALLAARQSHGSAFLLRGPPGVGKSRLTRELGRHARAQGVRVFVVRCDPAGIRPVAALRSLLSAVAAAVRDDGLQEELRAAIGVELATVAAHISPAMAELVPSTAPAISEPTGADGFSELAAEVVCRAVSVLGPSLLVFDDAHRLDATSADIVARLATRFASRRVLLVLAGRAERSLDPARGLASSRPAESFRRIDLPAFDRRAVLALVEAHVGGGVGAQLDGWVWRVSDGTPLGVLEVVEAMLESGALSPQDGGWRFGLEEATRMELPRGSVALFSRRLRDLPAASRRVFLAAAVVGDELDGPTLAAVVGVDLSDLELALAEGRRAGIIAPHDDGYRFTHESVREALLSEPEPSELRALHQQVAKVLDASGGADPYRLAHHYAAGHVEAQPTRVVEVAKDAMGRALDAYDNEAVLRFFTLAQTAAAAAGASLDAETCRRVAEAELRVGHHARSIAHLEDALQKTRAPLDRARTLGRMAWAEHMRSRPDAAWEALARAFREIGERMPVEAVGDALATALSLGRHRLLAAPRARSEPTSRLLCELHYQNARLGLDAGRPGRLLQSTLIAREIASTLGPSLTLAKTEAMYGAVMSAVGLRSASREHLDAARRLADGLGDPLLRAYCAQMEALAACYAGEFDEALAIYRAELRAKGHWFETQELCLNVFNAQFIETMRGRPLRAQAWITLATERAAQQGRPPDGFALIVLCARATRAMMTEPIAGEVLSSGASDAAIGRDLDGGAVGYSRTASWGARVRYHVERADFGPAFEAILREFEAEGIVARRAHPTLAEYYIAVAQARIHQRLRATDPAAQERHLAQLTLALADVRSIAKLPLFKAHLRSIEAFSAWFGGSPSKARAKLAQASALADRETCVRVRYDVERAHAHILASEGRPDAARLRASAAAHIAREEGAVHWERWITEELDVPVVTRSTQRTSSSSQSSSTLTTQRRQLSVLLRMLRAGAHEVRPAEQARQLVDELVLLTQADRAVLIFEDEGSISSGIVCGRTHDGQAWTLTPARCRSLVEAARRRGGPSASPSIGAADGSAVSLPLWLKEQVVGVVCVERSAACGPLDEDDLDLLVALSYQVPIALELARALEDRDRLEGIFHQAQKMQAVGHFAGEIAHDFNNMLMAMRGSLELLGFQEGLDPEVALELSMIRGVVDRATGLTRHLLAFSRRTGGEAEICDLNEVIQESSQMLRRLIPENVDMRLVLADEPARTMVDRALFEQMIVNLAANARDAMPKGGTLVMKVAHLMVDAAMAERHPDMHPGPHVEISVRDSGTGMSNEVQKSVFDPFFTTKKRGEGTGLGLAMVHGFVKHHRGSIELESEPGHGTLFRIYLPACAAEDEVRAMSEGAPVHRVELEGSHHTILVVEDEERVRRVLSRILSKLGYRVHSAPHAAEALSLLDELREPLSLVITDVSMPGMSGPEMAKEIQRRSPSTKLLFISGYSRDEIEPLMLDVAAPFLQKPFDAGTVRTQIREILEGGGAPRTPAEPI